MSGSLRPRSKYQNLLEDKDLRRWYENVVRGSPACAEIYLRNLGNFCQLNDINAPQTRTKVRNRNRRLPHGLVSSAQKKHAGSYIHNTTKVVESWLAHNGIQRARAQRANLFMSEFLTEDHSRACRNNG